MRSMSGQASVLVRGQPCPVVGNITMDTSMVDITDLVAATGPIEVGERVTLLGRQGGRALTVFDLARWGGVLPYEVLSGASKRVPRR